MKFFLDFFYKNSKIKQKIDKTIMYDMNMLQNYRIKFVVLLSYKTKYYIVCPMILQWGSKILI